METDNLHLVLPEFRIARCWKNFFKNILARFEFEKAHKINLDGLFTFVYNQEDCFRHK